jgi:recombination protein RecT
MANANDVKKQLATKEKVQSTMKTADQQMRGYLEKMTDQFIAALEGTGMSAARFKRMAFTAWNSNPKLQTCTPQSFLAALITSAQLGLEPNTPLGHAYIIPYKNKATFQTGYRGDVILLWRSGEVKSITTGTVYEKDEFDFQYGTNAYLHHKPYRGKGKGRITDYYAHIQFTNGGEIFYVMSAEEVDDVRKKFSKSAGSSDSPWKTNYEAMAWKTVLRRAAKLGPLSAEVHRQLAADGTIRSVVSKDLLDTQPDKETYEINEDYEQTEVTVIDDGTEGMDSEVFGQPSAEEIGFSK